MAAPNILAGISFPFRVENHGQPAADYGVDVIRSDLIGLLNTRKRSRVMRPEIGTNLHQLIFEDSGPILQSLIITEITTAIASQLPMVNVINIDFQTEASNERILHVNIRYSVQGIEDQTGYVQISRE
jgi:phage baseplate assembly protein W